MAFESQHIVSQRFIQCVTALIESRAVTSKRQFALSLDYKPQGLSDIFLGKRNVPVDLILRSVEKYNINARFLFSGEGEMFDTKTTSRQSLEHVVVTDSMQKERIVHVPVIAQAGYRDNLSEPVFMQELPTYSLPENILRDGSYRSFEIGGDSMEPTLISGDKVIGARVEPQFWEQGIKDNMIHILITYNEVLIKRVYNFIANEGMLELHSDNAVHKPFNVPVEDLREVWIVRLRITNNLTKPDGISYLDSSLQEMLADLKHQVEDLKRT